MKVYEIINEAPPGGLTGSAIRGAEELGGKVWRGGKWVFDKIKGGGSATKTATQGEQAFAKMAAELGAKEPAILTSAAKASSSLSTPVALILKGLGGALAAQQYWVTVCKLEAEYNKYLTGDKDNMFKDATSKDQAYQWFRDSCDVALGKLEMELGLVIAPKVGADLLKFVSKPYVLGWVPFVGKVPGLAGKFIEYTTGGPAGLVARGTILAYLETDIGKNFVGKTLVGEIIQAMLSVAGLFLGNSAQALLGEASRKIWAEAAELLKQGGEAMSKYDGPGKGIINPIGDFVKGAGQAMDDAGKAATKGNIEPPNKQQNDADDDANAKLPVALQKYTKGNITYIGGQAATDNSGKVLTGLEGEITRADMDAANNKVKNPYRSLPGFAQTYPKL
jgi:hypothetical protein